MRPIPVVFHIGPLTVHTYGIGLAITFYFAFRYYERRLRNNGYDAAWLHKSFLWIIGAAIVGARIIHVIANISYYVKNPGEIVMIWHGGLSSFGGLALAIPTAIYLKKRYAPELQLLTAFDLIAPVLMAAWSMGRFLGPQLMINGGGRPTTAWYGMEYAGQVGYRIPVPLFQGTEDLIIFLILLRLEKYFKNHGYPPGTLIGTMTLLWSITRFWDEYFWLAVPRLWDAVEVFSIILIIASVAYLIYINKNQSKTDDLKMNSVAEQTETSETRGI